MKTRLVKSCVRKVWKERKEDGQRGKGQHRPTRVTLPRRGNLLDVSAEGERGSLLEHQLEWLGDSVSSELGNPMEEGGLERTRTGVWRLLNLNVKFQEARAHRLLVF